MIRRHRKRIALWGACILFAAAMLSQSYLGRVQVRDSQVHGCLRAKSDRRDDVGRDQDIARVADAVGVEVDSDGRIDGATGRRRIVCEREYPHPSLLPWTG